MNWVDPTVRWYLVLAAVTWAFAPGVRWLCQPLADHGVTMTRPIAMLAAVYPAWLLASLGLLSFDWLPVVGVVIIAAAVGWVLTLQQRKTDRTWVRDLFAAELASLVFFAAYIWLRGYTPQILGTEKPMDIAFLASSTRAVTMPPPDPWFAGEPINYYYLGYLLHGTQGRLAGVSPEIGFNLALATVFSMTTVAAFGVAWNVIRPSRGPGLAAASGLFALFAVAVSGNLYTPLRLLENAQSTASAWWWDGVEGIGWRSSRIVCDGPRIDNLCLSPATETINEFPFFSFLLGDLHPHVMALPFTVVVIGLAWNLALKSREMIGTLERTWLLRVAVTGAILGSLYALNAWDFPTYLLLVALAVLIAVGARVRLAWKPIGLLLAAAVAAWSPYIATYVPPILVERDALPAFIERLPIVPRLLSVVGLHIGEHTSVGEYLTVFGTQYVFGIALVIAGIRGWQATTNGFVQTLVTSSVATIVPGVMLSAPVIPLCGIPLAFALAQLRDMRSICAHWFALTLVSFAWTLSIGVEIIYVRDVFEDRMNTLFKFYYQAWTLYGLAAALALAALWSAVSTGRGQWQRAALLVAATAALLAGASYPTIASYQWTDQFQEWRGLDGMAYGGETNPDDAAAIRWLASRAAPADVVLEAAGCSYYPFDKLPFNRVSAFTGVPTILGWANNHQRQWRAGQPRLIDEIGQRQADVTAMFADPESSLFDEYGIRWLFIGEYETEDWRETCPTAGPYDIGSFAEDASSRWKVAFQSGETRIYQRAGQ